MASFGAGLVVALNVGSAIILRRARP
jgi:hypothetical protein